MTAAGSSPLTRGKPASGPAFGQYPGLIPAHAGKTRRGGGCQVFSGAHPRSRGENVSRERPSGRSRGSSPLTRGKQESRTRGEVLRGLIPAHAGKTVWLGAAWLECGAHPRSRGENEIGGGGLGAHQGSSPLTRGKRRADRPLGARRGLIPAHAGKTTPQTPKHPAGGAHPRSRGENVRGSRPRRRARGSSPLTRGKHLGRGL